MKKIKVIEIVKGLFHLKFPNQYLMNSTLVRMQEYYESPKFKGKTFTLEDFMDWYVDHDVNKRFDYFTEVRGMNFPLDVLGVFYDGSFDYISKKEKMVLDFFRKWNVEGRYYIIATFGGKGELKHELAHGLYYLVTEYKKEVLNILRGVEIPSLRSFLKENIYSRYVYKDEAHAYMIEGVTSIYKEDFTSKDLKRFKKISSRLRKIYNKYINELRIDKYVGTIKI